MAYMQQDYAIKITELRKRLNLTQPQFGNLFGVHAMTVSKWERSALTPTNYQFALMEEFEKSSNKQEVTNNLGAILLGAGVVAALLLLLSNGKVK